MSKYRFRVDEGKLVLQVHTQRDNHAFGYQREPDWRDAKVEDIPVADPFNTIDRPLRGTEWTYGRAPD